LDALPTVALVFFAFVGWELMSFTTEEFKNPQRDFPLMVAISFIIVVVLYLLVAATIQLVLPRNHPQMANAPIAAMLTAVMGRGSGQFVSIMGILMVVANFISVVWAFSRLSFSSAREGLLPGTLARIHPEAQIPRNAVVASTGAFGAVAAFYFMGIVSQSLLFELAGISFFMSYMLAVLAYIKRVSTVAGKIFGTATLACVGFVFIGFGVKTIYPLALFVSGLLLYSVRANRGGVGGQP
jgi:amino acid efflux transporter